MSYSEKKKKVNRNQPGDEPDVIVRAFINTVRDFEESVHRVNEQMGSLSRGGDATKRAT